MSQAVRLQGIYRRFKKSADFYFIYIREAHPTDGWSAAPTSSGVVKLKDPKTFKERVATASACIKTAKFTIPVLVDDMADSAGIAYGAYPNRLYVVGSDGKIAFRGNQGPDVDAMIRALELQLAKERKKK